MSLIGFEELYYDYEGNIISTNINPKYDDCWLRFSSKPYLGYTCTKFNNGDFVIRKNQNDETAYIVEKVEGKDDLRSYSGYMLYDPIYKDYANDLPESLYYDQDLIKVEICPRCFAAITERFKINYEQAGYRCPRCLTHLKIDY